MFTVFDMSVIPCRTYEFGTLIEAVEFLVKLGLPDGLATVTMPPRNNQGE